MINMVALMGRLTFEPELKTTPAGVSVIRFQVACDRNFQRAGQERQADFIDCVAWRQTAEFVSKYFSKGSMIGIEGNLRTGSYKDKTYPDVTHYTTDLFVENVEFVGSKNNNADNSGSNYSTPAPTQAVQSSSTGNNSSYGNLNEFEEILSDGEVPF